MYDPDVIHRDIAPDNIILLHDGRMNLTDFGAARSYLGDKSMTVVVKKGFAPVEQYMSRGSSAATDVYALAATIYYCVTGKVPPDSAERQYGDIPLESPAGLGADLTPGQETALTKALALQQKARTQSVQEFLEQLHAKEMPKPIPKSEPQKKKKKKPAVLAAVLLLAVIVAGILLFPDSTTENETLEVPPTVAETTEATPPPATRSASDWKANMVGLYHVAPIKLSPWRIQRFTADCINDMRHNIFAR
jgi:serine/threonine protein kinase